MMVYDVHMTKKLALCSGRIDKARGVNVLGGINESFTRETDSEFNGSVLHGMSRDIIQCDGDDNGRTYDEAGARR